MLINAAAFLAFPILDWAFSEQPFKTHLITDVITDYCTSKASKTNIWTTKGIHF